jgi:hypothetical protein
MKHITYENIRISPYRFTVLHDVQIFQDINRHPLASVTGIVSPDQKDAYLSDTDAAVKIGAVGDDGLETLFCGVVSEIFARTESGNCVLHILAAGSTALLDVQRGNGSFQNFGKTYAEIMRGVVGSDGQIQTFFQDRALSGMEVRYGETQWEFVRKLSAKIGACVVPECTGEVPQLYVGLPDIPLGKDLSRISYTQGVQIQSYQKAIRNGESPLPDDFIYVELVSHDFAGLGRKVLFDGKWFWVKKAHSYFEGGYLLTRFTLAQKGGFSETAAQESSLLPAVSRDGRGAEDQGLREVAEYANVRAAVDVAAETAKEQKRMMGRMFYGQVTAVQQDKIQVHISDLDAEADSGSTQWFPYATPYAPSDGSGWYVMPETGDTVRVYFPGNDPSKAFAFSALGKTSKPNPNEKSWKTPKGKEILMNDDGVYIINKEDVMLIEMTDDGIAIKSDLKITLDAVSEIDIKSKRSITLNGAAGVNLSGGENKSSILLSPEAIEITADGVYSN